MEHDRVPRLLIAASPTDLEIVFDVLGKEFDLVICHTYHEACNRLDDSIDLIVCGVHFDRGRMFDLIRHVKANPSTRNVPFFLALGRNRTYTPAIVDGIRTAALSLGATDFVNLREMIETIGKPLAYEWARDIVRRHAKSPSATSPLISMAGGVTPGAAMEGHPMLEVPSPS